MSRDNKLVLCPFYKDDTSHSIRCEGIITEGCSNNFRGDQQKKEHINKYCKMNYNDCEYCKAVMKKY